jgi:hypothetical protein
MQFGVCGAYNNYMCISDNQVLIHVMPVLQGGVATTLTQPIDVIKTRTMNARPGEFKVNNHIQHSGTACFKKLAVVDANIRGQ